MKTKIAIVLLMAGAAGISLQAAQSAATSSPAKETNAASGAAATSADKKPDEVIAKGKGVSVTRAQLNESIASITAGMAARGQAIPRDEIETLEPQLLERLITMQVLAANATEQDKQKAKKTLDERMAEIKKRSGSKEALDAQLKKAGLTMTELESRLGEEAIAEAVLESGLKPEATDADAKKFYDDNPSKFEQPELIRASHILLMTQDENGKELPAEKKDAKRKQIEDLLKKARAGEDFAALAKKYSEDPGSKDKGGEYTFPKGQMVPEFEKAALSLKTNEVSDVVTTQYGYHIIKLSENIPAKKVPYEEVAPKIKEALKAQKIQQGMSDYVQKLRKDADVKILDEKLKPRPQAATGPAEPAATAEPQAKPANGTKK